MQSSTDCSWPIAGVVTSRSSRSSGADVRDSSHRCDVGRERLTSNRTCSWPSQTATRSAATCHVQADGPAGTSWRLAVGEHVYQVHARVGLSPRADLATRPVGATVHDAPRPSRTVSGAPPESPTSTAARRPAPPGGRSPTLPAPARTDGSGTASRRRRRRRSTPGPLPRRPPADQTTEPCSLRVARHPVRVVDGPVRLHEQQHRSRMGAQDLRPRSDERVLTLPRDQPCRAHHDRASEPQAELAATAAPPQPGKKRSGSTPGDRRRIALAPREESAGAMRERHHSLT